MSITAVSVVAIAAVAFVALWLVITFVLIDTQWTRSVDDWTITVDPGSNLTSNPNEPFVRLTEVAGIFGR